MNVEGDIQSGGPGPALVLFEDGDVLAVSKPEGIASIPERHHEGGSLRELLESAARAKLYVVHRIDKDASGVILFAKNAAAHRCLNDQFSRREVEKTYLALVHGVVGAPGGTVDARIRAFGSGRMGIDESRGKPSSTSYDVVRRLIRFTLLEARPESGRRHQIRIHMYSIGHPIVGDRMYGDGRIQERYPRLMLHALRITFRLPSGEAATVGSPIPKSFASVLDEVERAAPSTGGGRA